MKAKLFGGDGIASFVESDGTSQEIVTEFPRILIYIEISDSY